MLIFEIFTYSVNFGNAFLCYNTRCRKFNLESLEMSWKKVCKTFRKLRTAYLPLCVKLTDRKQKETRLGLTPKKFSRLYQIIECIFKMQAAPESIWCEIRQHYVLLCELVECVDDNLKYIVLLSSANSLYFLSNQILTILELFHIVHPKIKDGYY